ncbi:ATP-binding protein [Chitinimonas sp. JJ19]|uniref:ATP-binding protein n=1 Tax=Chitinimonas sp. JJ19 TaxID=3109352 RepID=UPI003000F8F5
MRLRYGLRSIRYKLLLTLLASNLCTLLVAAAVLIYNDLQEYRLNLSSELNTQAEILGQASIAALEFNDPKVAQENLALLKIKPGIIAAGLYTATGTLFAGYSRQRSQPHRFPPLPGLDGIQIADKEMWLYKRVVNQQEILGTVYLRAHYDLQQRLQHNLGILAGVGLLSLLASLLISTWLQTYVSKPITSVSDTALQVVSRRDFSLRAHKSTDDEIGYLVDAFNEMLAEIGRRTEAIEASQQALEHEVAERRETQLALQHSERRNRSLLTAMSVTIWVSDKLGGFAAEQPAWADYTGQPLAEYQGLGWRSAFHPDDQGHLDRAWARAISQPASFELAARLWHAGSGRHRHITLRTAPLFDQAGELVEWIGGISDTDDRYAAEQAVVQLNAELEQRVAERTAELETANKELESFSYSVSHDLRAPVRAIGGFAALLNQHQGAQLNTEGQRLLGIVRSEATRMGYLIDDLLAFSRLGRQAMQMKPLDMMALVQNTYSHLQNQHQGPPVQFRLGNLPDTLGDMSLLRQVWVNLLSNALKFSSKQAQPTIEVGAISDDEKHTYYVRDNGTGFDPAYKQKLFGVFQRLHDAADYPGTGVGLALAQRIINRHNGTIWADSTPGEGATFYFTLPRSH